MVELAAELEKSTGEISRDVDRIVPGGTSLNAEARVGDVAIAAGQASTDLMSLNDYVLGLSEISSGPLAVLGDTRWLVKTSTTLHIGPNDTHAAD